MKMFIKVTYVYLKFFSKVSPRYIRVKGRLAVYHYLENSAFFKKILTITIERYKKVLKSI